ncbi:MAG TPA: hypothetical protein VM052_00630 [Candidatus Limnocylindrales bacterium]|nr:hypothetical protein [Candidatus Limnocylindrales bacterium]
MRTTVPCGSTGESAALPGTIDDVTTLHYSTGNAAFDEAVRSSTRASISADCSTVTFLFGIAAPSGTFTVSVVNVQDRAGTSIDSSRGTARFTVQDQGRPVVSGVSASGDVLTVSFSEPMLQIGEGGGVTMSTNYLLNRQAIPATSIVCLDAGCRSVRITLRPRSLIVGKPNELQIANVVDRAGLNITPDPTTRTF